MLMPILKFDESVDDRILKLLEEFKEVVECHKTQDTIENLLSEYFDVISVCITNMNMIATPEQIKEASNKHLSKTLDRKYEIVGMINYSIDSTIRRKQENE